MQIERGSHEPKTKQGIYKRMNQSVQTKTQNWDIHLDQLEYLISIAKLTGSFEVTAGEFDQHKLPNLSEHESDSDSDKNIYNLKLFQFFVFML